MRKLLNIVALGFVVLALVVGPAASGTRAADHLDAPLVRTDSRIDITDIYAYVHGRNTVFVLNINPLAGAGGATTFRPDALYQIKIDNTGDAKADIAFRFRFGKVRADGTQRITMFRVTGPDAEKDISEDDEGGSDDDNHSGQGEKVAQGWTSRGSAVNVIPIADGGKLYAGLRDDPFFFDLAAFVKFEGDHNPADFCSGPGGTGTDFFKGLNVSSIVFQIPTKSLLGSSGPVIYPWGAVSLRDANGEWTQVERMGKPALATVFIKPVQNQKYSDAYNATPPSQDLAMWGSFFPDNPIPLLGGITVRNLLLPDVLILNTAGPLVINGIPFDGYPNGRRLTDDVIDTSFAVLANAGVLPSNVTTDCVGNDSNFSAKFPYLAPPN